MFELPGSMNPVFGIGREEDAALEAVVPRQDPRQRRQRFLPRYSWSPASQTMCLPAPGPFVALIDDEVGICAALTADAIRNRDHDQQHSSTASSREFASGRRRSLDARTTSSDARITRGNRSTDAWLSCHVRPWPDGPCCPRSLSRTAAQKVNLNRPLHDARVRGPSCLAEARVDLLARRIELRVRVERSTSSPG